MLLADFCANFPPHLATMRLLFHREESRPLPPREPVHSDVPELHEAEVAAVYYGQRQGGDFYDFIRVSGSRVLFGLLDVAGQLEQNRAIVTAAQQTFRSQAAELFASDEINEADAMARLCLELNRTILTAERGIRSCPAFAGCYNESLGTVCYFNAGHTPGLLRHGSGVTELAATGLPLGLFSHVTCDAPTAALEPGAALVLVSRGMLEGKYRGEEFGLPKVKDSLQRATAGSAKELCLTLLDQVHQYMRTPPTHNDVTALALVRAATAKAAALGS